MHGQDRKGAIGEKRGQQSTLEETGLDPSRERKMCEALSKRMNVSPVSEYQRNFPLVNTQTPDDEVGNNEETKEKTVIPIKLSFVGLTISLRLIRSRESGYGVDEKCDRED